MIQQFGRYVARIRFRIDDDFVLRPECEPWQGHIVVVEALWVIEDGETIYNAGEWAMRVHSPLSWPRDWIASGDLEILGEAQQEPPGVFQADTSEPQCWPSAFGGVSCGYNTAPILVG